MTLHPAPRHVEHLGGSASYDVVAVARDATLPAQGYELVTTSGGTTIRHRDELGLRYAQQTRAQLVAGDDRRSMRIVDHPDFEHRGFMLDISRDRVPSDDTLAWLVEVLAELRYNHLELYTEHTFAYAGHDDVWGAASPLTPAELRALDDRCADAGIALVANQNTFGHMERWLRHEAHRWRAECPDGATNPFTGAPMPPATLAPTPDNATFAVDLVRELAAHLRSSMVNIGADEPFELGQCASAEAVAARGRAAVYLEHLDRLIRPLVADGRHVLFWGDVLRRHPDLVARLPEAGATAVVWCYEAPSDDTSMAAALGPDLLETMGLPDDFHLGFAAHTRSYAASGYPFWVAPGTSSWNALLGRWSNARANLLDAAVTGRALGAEGYLVTDWGDNGHLQPLIVSLLPLVYGAGVAWCADANAGSPTSGVPSASTFEVVDRLSGLDGLGERLAALGDAHALTGVTTFNGSPLFAALDPTRPLPLIGRGEPAGHAAAGALLEGSLGWLGSLPISAGVHGASLLAAVRLARHGAWRLASRAGAPAPDRPSMAADIAECLDLQRAAWLATSRPGGLDDSLHHLPTY